MQSQQTFLCQHVATAEGGDGFEVATSREAKTKQKHTT